MHMELPLPYKLHSPLLRYTGAKGSHLALGYEDKPNTKKGTELSMEIEGELARKYLKICRCKEEEFLISCPTKELRRKAYHQPGHSLLYLSSREILCM